MGLTIGQIQPVPGVFELVKGLVGGSQKQPGSAKKGIRPSLVPLVVTWRVAPAESEIRSRSPPETGSVAPDFVFARSALPDQL
jgi:hypothetical protein